jgi:hypothetical protein
MTLRYATEFTEDIMEALDLRDEILPAEPYTAIKRPVSTFNVTGLKQ